jgi:hypothetical protein
MGMDDRSATKETLVPRSGLKKAPRSLMGITQEANIYNVMLNNSWANLCMPSRILSACFFLGTARSWPEYCGDKEMTVIA